MKLSQTVAIVVLLIGLIVGVRAVITPGLQIVQAVVGGAIIGISLAVLEYLRK